MNKRNPPLAAVPRRLRWPVALLLALLLMVGTMVMPAFAASSDLETVYVTGIYHQTEARSMLKMINDFRTGKDAWYWNETNSKQVYANDLQPLTYDYKLEEYAMQRAMEIALNFDHVRPNGESCFTVGAEVNGENIAAGGGLSAASAFQLWQETDQPYAGQGHRRNMLKNWFTAVGIACVNYNGVTYWVQEFGEVPTGAAYVRPHDSNRTLPVEIYTPYVTDCTINNTNTVSTLTEGIPSIGPASIGANITMVSTWPYRPCKVSVQHGWTAEDPSIVTITDDYLMGERAGTTTLHVNFLGQSGSTTVQVLHHWDGGAVTSYPDYGVTGIRTFTCTHCGETRTEIVPALMLPDPSLISVENVTGGVKLTWGEYSEDVRFRVYRKTAGKDWSRIGETTVSSYVDTTAVLGTTYTYTVRCVNDDGTRFISDFDHKGLTITAQLTTPKLTKAEQLSNGLKISWEKVAGAEKYRVYRKLPHGSWARLGDTTATSYADTTAQSGETYVYTVRCLNAAASTFTSDFDHTGLTATMQLATPKLSKIENTGTGVKVTWGKVTGAAKYRVYRKTTGGSWSKLADTTSTTYTDTSAKNGTTYTYTVRCMDADGANWTSGYDSKGLTITAKLSMPKLTKAVEVKGGVQVTWEKLAGAEKYRVYRKTPGADWKRVGDTTSTSYVDTTTNAGITYIYTVRCVNAAGTAFTSSYDPKGLTITPQLPTPKLLSVENVADGVQVNWEKTKEAFSTGKYRIYRKTAGTSWTRVADWNGYNVGPFVDTTVVPGTTYTYTVRCVNLDGTVFTSGFDSKGLTITAAQLTTPRLTKVENVADGIKVSWNRVNRAEKYRVYRKTADTGWTKLGDTTYLSFVDTTAEAGVEYTYTVRCLNKAATVFTSSYDRTGLTITRSK